MNKTGKIAKKVSLLLMALLMTVFFVGCGGLVELSDAFEEDKVLELAEEIGGYLNEGNYEAVEALVSDDFTDELNAKMMEETIGDGLSSMGEFKGFTDGAVVGITSKDYEGDIAVATMTLSYENGDKALNISFNTDYEIIGMFIS